MEGHLKLRSETEEWLVQVYRHTNVRGWEKYIHPTNNASTSISPSQNDDSSNDDLVIVTPRKGCVEVRQLRLRIHLVHPQNKKSNSKTPQSTAKSTLVSPENQNKQANHNVNKFNPKPKSRSEQASPHSNTVVIQRLDTVLLSTRKGGAVVLKFRNKLECNCFSDKLISLNMDLMPTNNNSILYSENSQMPSIYHLPKPMNYEEMHKLNDKKRKNEENRNNSSLTQGWTGKKKRQNISSLTTPNAQVQANPIQKQRKNNVFTYIVRLLHDPSFLEFVDDIEKVLASSPECSGVLSALGIRP